MPNLASAHEQKLADFEAPTWFAVFLPRGASEPIIRKLNQAAFATADTPSVQERLNALASAPLFPKFVSEGAEVFHELRKRGTRAETRPHRPRSGDV